MEDIRWKVRFSWTVRHHGLFVLYYAHVMLYSLLFMLGTSCLVIGFSFAESHGCMSCPYSTQHLLTIMQGHLRRPSCSLFLAL
jgi:hypothetical protein